MSKDELQICFKKMGKGNAFNEHGDEPVEMNVDNKQCPLDEATNFNTYMDLKPPERLGKIKTIKNEIVAGQQQVHQT